MLPRPPFGTTLTLKLGQMTGFHYTYHPSLEAKARRSEEEGERGSALGQNLADQLQFESAMSNVGERERDFAVIVQSFG